MWRKQGLIFAPVGDLWWASSYAHLPTVEQLDPKTLRIYFASLDEHKHGRIGFIDVDANDPKVILNVSREPILDIGAIGTFDDSGVNPSCIINHNGTKYLYYIGWQRSTRVPYMLFSGLATSADGVNFKKVRSTPILDRTPNEPYIRSATSIIFDQNRFKSWYVSASEWITVENRLYPSYIIRYAESANGFDWNTHDPICINLDNDNEFGIGRPWVILENNLYKMWYSIRSKTHPYKIGYAESANGLNWVRKDDSVGIHRSESGWDSEMICYPCVIDVNGRRYMFYNGNQHGSTGFGYAVYEG